MGQKVNPNSFRLICRKSWRSVWYANKKEFSTLVLEDQQIRRHLEKKPACAGADSFTIRRMSGKIEVVIHTARPGLVIGKKGAEIEVLKQGLKKLTGKDIWIEVDEIKRPDLSAKLVAENIARQLSRRVPFRRAMKKAIQQTMDAGARGVKVRVAGRLGGAEIARAEWDQEGSVPLHTLRANIDYAAATGFTTYGALGVKVWVNRGMEPGQKEQVWR